MLSLSQAHFDGVASLIGNWDAGHADRLRVEAHLDGLRIEGDDSVALAAERLAAAEDVDEVATAALVLLECGDRKDAQPVLDRLMAGELDLCDAIRRGLRLARIGKILDELQTQMHQANAITRAAIADVLTFHRGKISIDLNELARLEEPMIRRCAAEAAGRRQNPTDATLVRALIEDQNPTVRRSALRGSARLRLQGLDDLCRTRAVADIPCLDSIRFLSVCGTEVDAKLLIQLSKNETTALAAVYAMGGIGVPVLIPTLIELLANPELADPAAIALERIASYSVPRGDPPAPPPDATEDALDFWDPPSPPIPGTAQNWWTEKRNQFTDGKRYQAGICVSDNPLGERFDELPDQVRFELYLRERARGGESVPDWELETWPQYQRKPDWSLGSAPVA